MDDPNETLRLAKIFLKMAEEAKTEGEKVAYMVSALRSFETLDEWLSKGGFLPESWSGAHRNAY